MSITLKEGTKAIADSAFYRCRGLDRITIPQGVERIGAKAFSGCALTSVSIPSSVTYIGDSAFDYPVENITFHGGITELSSSAFIYTNWYQNQPDGLVYIDQVAYNYKGQCPSTVSIKPGTATIGNQLFSDKTGLTSVTLPDSIKYIGESAFYGCSSLDSISIPSGVTKIGSRAPVLPCFTPRQREYR